MKQRIFYSRDYVPEFGIPWDVGFEGVVGQLSDAELGECVTFKEWLGGEVEEAAILERLRGMTPSVRRVCSRFLGERLESSDAVTWGFTLPGWRVVLEDWGKWGLHVILGGNRSSKSTFMSRLFVWMLMNIPECRLRAYHVNQEKSISEQQALIWAALPQRYKDMAKKKGTNFSIQYTQKNGFSGNKLILPPLKGFKRGGELLFGTYQQYVADPQVVEGWWAHAVWGDEEAPIRMVERLLTRVYDTKGTVFLTFTTIQGWSPLVADLMSRKKTLKQRYAKLLGRSIPCAEVALNDQGKPKAKLDYFWTEDNPFVPKETMERMAMRNQSEILAIAYGIPTKPAESKFPKFDETLHVVPHEKIPFVAEPEKNPVTRYMVIDPSGSKPWFVIWAAVNALGHIYVYREYPDFGMWAEQGDTPEGKPGDACRPDGKGISEYVELFRHMEDQEHIFERIIDPRLGRAAVKVADGSTDIITELESCGMTVFPAPGKDIDHGLQLINDKLNWNPDKPIGILNSPKLFISERCHNVIDAFKNYTGKGGKDEAWKDPIDTIRYLLENSCEYVSTNEWTKPQKTFSY